MPKSYWLMKSEPTTFSFENLKEIPNQATFWEGVRNYQARNFLRDDIKVGDGVLFYHSNAKPTAVMGAAKVIREGYPDPTQFDPKSKYYDPDSPRNNPRWYRVDIQFDKEFKNPVTLEEMRKDPSLKDMMLLKKGTRLSVLPVSTEEWKTLLRMGEDSYRGRSDSHGVKRPPNKDQGEKKEDDSQNVARRG